MALTQLKLYNRALAAFGQRQLTAIEAAAADKTEAQIVLDDIYLDSDNGALNYCLELAQPSFARKTLNLTGGSASAIHDLDKVYNLPSNYVTLITRPDGKASVYSNATLTEEVARYIIEGRTLACDFDPVYIRYIANDYTMAEWEPSFIEVMVYYLAMEAATRLDSAEQDRLTQVFQAKVQTCRELAEARDRPLAENTTFTLDADYLNIYNDALLLLGLEQIASTADNSVRRTVLDTAMNTGLVEEILEDTGWQFGKTTEKLEYNPGIEPAFGYNRAFDKPSNLLRINGIYHDEYFQSPVDYYIDEGDYFFADLDELYIEYISRAFLTTPAQWPMYFRKLVAAALAQLAGPSIPGANIENAMIQYDRRKKSAVSNNAIAGPPRKIRQGSWTSSVLGYRRNNRDRP